VQKRRIDQADGAAFGSLPCKELAKYGGHRHPFEIVWKRSPARTGSLQKQSEACPPLSAAIPSHASDHRPRRRRAGSASLSVSLPRTPPSLACLLPVRVNGGGGPSVLGHVLLHRTLPCPADVSCRSCFCRPVSTPAQPPPPSLPNLMCPTSLGDVGHRESPPREQG
jgi:hypothetical protein